MSLSEKSQSVNEAAAVYLTKMSLLEELHGPFTNLTFNDFLDDKLLLIQSIRKGISFAFFSEIKKTVPFSDEDWATLLNISTKSLQRYAREEDFLFKPIHSEKIIEIAEVTNLGNEVFDDQDQFHLWLHTPSYALGAVAPIELLNDSYGKEMVLDELHKIDQGIFA